MTLNVVLSRRDIARIVIIKPSALGDVVQSLPLLPALRRRFPAARIAWVVQSGLQDLLTGHPDLDEILPFHRRGTWSAWGELLRRLASGRFDLALDLQGLLRTGIMTAATRAPLRVGLETAREGSRWTVTHVVPETGRAVPAGERYLRLLDALGAERASAQTKIAVSPLDDAWAEQATASLPRPLLAVHPGARWVTKRWPAERFADVLSRAVREWRAGVLIVGGNAERPEASALANRLAEAGLSDAVRDLTGETSLKQLTAILRRVDAMISNDSGPMHLAAASGTPTLGVFTCTDAIRSGPGGLQHETVSTTVACRGSYRKTCPHGGTAHLACLRELDVVRVWSALERLVQKNEVVRRRPAAA
jgi:lipopolysaccharide heptosyltransferase II